MGQNFVWVGQARVWVGRGLPGLIARTAFARDLDLWPSDPKINGFPGLIVEPWDICFVCLAILAAPFFETSCG